MKKYIGRFAALALLIAGAVGIYLGLDYLLSDDSKSQTRVTFHDFYSLDSLDTLFVGTSHTIHGVNAVKLTEDLGESVFSLASSNQDLAGGYYVIKDALEKYDVKQVFYEISLSRFMVVQPGEVATYIVTDYLENPVLKTQMITDLFPTEKYVNAFLRLRRNVDPTSLPPGWKLGKTYRNKSEKSYKEYLGTDAYLGRGMWAVNSQLGVNGTIAVNLDSSHFDHFTADNIVEREWNYYLKIMDLCQEKGVKLTLYMMPYIEMYFMCFDQYEDIVKRIADEAALRGIDFIDLNLAKNEYLDMGISDFYNLDHVNTLASEEIADFLEMYLANPEGDYFHSCIEEKYPRTDGVKAVAYTRSYITDTGDVFDTRVEAEAAVEDGEEIEGISKIRVDISPLAYVDIRAAARVWMVQYNDETDTWEDVREYPGTRIDDYHTVFDLPYDALQNHYRIELSNPDTGEVIYTTLDRFNMT